MDKNKEAYMLSDENLETVTGGDTVWYKRTDLAVEDVSANIETLRGDLDESTGAARKKQVRAQ